MYNVAAFTYNYNTQLLVLGNFITLLFTTNIQIQNNRDPF